MASVRSSLPWDYKELLVTYFDDKQSLYEVLGLGPNANDDEVMNAYRRILSEIETDYLALYSMVDDAELAGRRRRVQMAFETLSDPGKRANYDGDDAGYPSLTVSPQASVTPDRGVAVATSVSTGDTSFSHTGEEIDEGEFQSVQVEPRYQSRFAPRKTVRTEPSAAPQTEPRHRAAERALNQTMTTPEKPTPTKVVLTPEVLAELTADKDISGALLKTLRETAGLSLDDIAATTKISKRYLRAIEADDYATLPAKVYTRGFVTLYARMLGLDAERVATSFIELIERGGGGA
ncbi:MAG: DnaJ domain-containing protein [Deltaproteobacteria bacterium]|nr:DnaJ domain-containing protein [Deltaproteobacteria bacterium]